MGECLGNKTISFGESFELHFRECLLLILLDTTLKVQCTCTQGGCVLVSIYNRRGYSI